MNGKRPVFVDDWLGLLLPVPAHPVRRDPARRRSPGGDLPSDRGRADGRDLDAAGAEEDLEIDEDFLRRIREV